MKFVNWLGLGALAMSGVAQAGLYVGGAGSMSQYEYENVDDATGFTAFAGYRPESLPLMVELAYTDFGDHDISGAGATIGFSGVRGSIGYFGRLSPTGSGVWIKGGYYSGDAEGELSGFGSDEQSSSGFTWGLGGDWKVTPNIGLRLDLESYMGVKDFNGYPTLGNESDVTVISLGLVLELPTRGQGGNSARSYAPPPAPAPAPAAYVPPPAPMPAPVPAPVVAEPKPVPVAPAAVPQPTTVKPDLPGGMAAIGVRLTAQPTMLLRQPRSGAPVDGNIPAGAEVQLLQRVPNAQGVWWYVSYNGNTGWVSDIALK